MVEFGHKFTPRTTEGQCRKKESYKSAYALNS